MNGIRAIQGDSSKLDDLDRVYEVIKQEKGKLDVVFANAGITDLQPLGLITEEFYNNIFNVNVKGVLFTVQKALPILNDGGSIILNGSRRSIKGRAATSICSASKAAVRSFARCWSIDLKDRKIRVNVVSPGSVNTPMLNSLGKTKEESIEIIEQLKKLTVLNRIAEPIEVAKPVLFLASDDSSYITGIELFIDGGASQI